jgi:MipA family protein
MNLISTLLFNHRTRQTALPALRLAAVATIACVFSSAAPTFAQPTSTNTTSTNDKKSEGPWNASVGLFAVTMPEYEGARRRVSSALPDFNLSYRTDDWGTFGVGSKSRGVSWTVIDKEQYSLGFTIGGSTVRTEKNGTAFRPGGKLLKGMGEIKATEEYGVFGHVVAGIPIRLQIMKGSGDGKPDAKNFATKGHAGTHAQLGTEIPCAITTDVGLSFSAGLNWADKKYTQTYFGVTSAQAARSRFKQFTTKGGIKSVELGVALNYKIDKNWSAITNLNYSQLRGDAATSPVIEKKSQPMAAIGVNYTF